MKRLVQQIAQLETLAKNTTRFAIVVVFIWIGSLKFFTYEADGNSLCRKQPFYEFFL